VEDPTQPDGVRAANAGDIPALATSLARAFATDPVQRWIVPVHNRQRRMAELFHHLLGMELEVGRVDTTPDGVAAAIWAAPGRWRLDERAARPLAEASERILGANLVRSVRLAQVMEANHPDDRLHWYLATLGTHPDWQRRGIGTRVLRPVLARCDEEGVPAYLESSKEQNVPYYRRHGFEVTASFDVAPDGPTLWGMWREPRPR
jgi:ribosomal protein S18 acetylase RimI-like enzyme